MGTIISVSQAYLLRSVSISIEAEFGFGNYLSLFFWVGIFVIIIGTFLTYKWGHTHLFLAALIMLASVIWGLPAFSCELSYHQDTFWHLSNVRWVERNTLDFNLFQPYTRFAYLEYPSFFLGQAILELLAVPNAILLSDSFMIGVTALFVLNFYLLARFLTQSTARAGMATLFAVVANVDMFSNHFSPSAIAQALFPLMIYLALRTGVGSKQVRYFVVVLVLTFFYVTLHSVMSLVLLVVIGSLIVVFHFGSRFVKDQVPPPRIETLLFMMLIYFSWSAFISGWGFTELGQSLERLFISISEPWAQTTLSTTILRRQTLLFPLVGWAKRGIFIVFIVPALVVFLKRILRREICKIDITFATLLFFSFLSSLVTQLSDRILVWTIPFAVLVLFDTDFVNTSWRRVVRVSKNHLPEVAVMLAVFSLATLSLLTYYSGVAAYITTPAENEGYHHLAVSLTETDRIFNGYSNSLFLYGHLEKDYTIVQSMQFANVLFFPQSLYSRDYREEGKSFNLYSMEFNQSLHDQSLNLIYSNGDFTIFRRDNR